LPKQGAGTEEINLATWISNQRTAKRYLDEGIPSSRKMTPERIGTLESMSWWSWHPLEDEWQSKFEELVDYVEKTDKIPPRSHPALGFWVNNQRQAFKAWQACKHGETEKHKDINSNMDEERARKLESVPGWLWDPIEDNWEAKYQELIQYVAEENKIPSTSHPTLGNWVNNQRMAYRAWQARLNGETEKYKGVLHCMNEERVKKLESVPGWKWYMRD